MWTEGDRKNKWVHVGKEGASKPGPLQALLSFSFSGGISLLMRALPS